MPKAGSTRGLDVLLAAFAIALALWVTRQAEYAGFYWDDAFYLRMAELLSPWQQHVPAGLHGMVRERGYPLLYPGLLGWLGGGTNALAWTYVLNGLLIGAGWWLLWKWALSALGGRLAAACVLALAIINLQTMQVLNVLLSEHLYVPLSLGCLLAWRQRTLDPRLAMAAALLAGLAAATRGIGIVLPLALSFVVLAGREPRRMLVLLAAWAPWAIERVLWTRLGLPGYGGAMAAALPEADPAAWMAFMAQQATALWDGWTGSLTPVPALARPWLIACALLALAGLVRQWRKLELEAVYATGYLAIVVLWPFPSQMPRFLLPILPLLVYAAWSAISMLPWRDGASVGRVRMGFLGLGVLSVTPATLVLAAAALAAPLPPELEALRRTPEWMGNPDRAEALEVIRARRGWLDDMRVVDAHVPPSDCVYSELFPVVMARTRATVALPPWHSFDEAIAAVPSAGCGYYYFVPLMLRGAGDPEAVDRFAAMHTLIHRSASPRDPRGKESLGLLLRRRPAQ
jgi:hypothetical protein